MKPGARRAALALSAAAVLVGLVVIALGPPAGTPRSAESVLHALSPQECNTRCQSRRTDCIIECDGAAACERGCVRAGEECTARCRALARDAGAKLP